MRRFGISQSQWNGVFQQIVNQAEGVLGSAVPLITSIFGFIFDMIIVAVLSIYLLVDGSRVIQWLRTNMPLLQRERTLIMLGTFERGIGGYIRGQLLLSTLVGVLVGACMAVFQVPYAVLLGVISTVLNVVPILS